MDYNMWMYIPEEYHAVYYNIIITFLVPGRPHELLMLGDHPTQWSDAQCRRKMVIQGRFNGDLMVILLDLMGVNSDSMG